MKKIFVLIISLLTMVSCSKKYADDFEAIRDKIKDVERILNELCDETNAQMEALKAIVKAFETRDYITSIEPLYVDGVEYGYEIHFLKGDTVTITHGIDGRNGQDGEDGSDGNPGQDGSHGSDGNSVKIGVKQGNDGKWYWTVDYGDGYGERWLRDADGNKVPASPEDGKDGEDGEDGKDGEDGQNGANGNPGRPGQDGEDGKDGADGKDGVTPRLKIEDGYWYLSLDGGKTWEKFGKATGDDGLPGPDAVTPEVLIESVRWDDTNAYFTLKSGDIITIPFKKPFGLQFEQTADIPVGAGKTVNVPYTILGVDDETEIHCVCEGGWKAEVVKENFFSGHIAVRAPYPFAEGKVLVMAQNAADDLVMQSLTFKEDESQIVLFGYSDNIEELGGWEEGFFLNSGLWAMGKEVGEKDYAILLGDLNKGPYSATLYVDAEGNLREIFIDNMSIVCQKTSEGTDVSVCYIDDRGEVVVKDFKIEPQIQTRSGGETSAGSLEGLFSNLFGIAGSIYDLMHGKADAQIIQAGMSFIVEFLSSIDNSVDLISGYKPSEHLGKIDAILNGSDVILDLATVAPAIYASMPWVKTKIDDLIAKGLYPNAIGLALLVADVWMNFKATYDNLYDENIKAYYGNCTAQISDIEVDGSTATIKVSVAGWESYYNTLEVGLAVSDFIHPSINDGSSIQGLTHNGEYVFTESGLKIGATYHCRPFVADKSRESLWNGWLVQALGLSDIVSDLTGPLVRYGDDRSFSIPTPSASTGAVEETTDHSAVVACSFSNVPSGGSCGVEVYEGEDDSAAKKVSASKDAKSVTLGGLEAATTYSYRAYVTYQGHTYYGATKELTTDLPDVSGTWTCKEIHENSDGTISTVSYSVTLNKDGTVTLGKDEYYNASSWSRTKTKLSVSWSMHTGYGSYWSSSSTDLSITFDDPQNPTSGKGAAYRTNANSTVGGFAPKFYANIEMSR